LSSPAIRTMDTASTALWLLGVQCPSDWAGSAVVGAYHAVAAASVSRD